MSDQILYADQVVVQIATSYPNSDEGWMTQTAIRFEGGSEDVGNQLGSAILVQDFGDRNPSPNISRFAYIPDPELNGSLGGMFVRVLVQDDEGDVHINGDTFTAFWWGVINQPSSAPDGAQQYVNGTITWHAQSIASTLDQIAIDHGCVLASTSAVAKPGECPVFNKVGRGDRSATQVAVGNGVAYVHDLYNFLGSANYWIAADVVNLLLIEFTQPQIGPDYVSAGIPWILNDPDNCLDFVLPETNLNGLTVLTALNTIISEARGLTWWSDPQSNGTIVITVQSTNGSAAVVCPSPPIGLAYTYPTASVTTDFDITQRGEMEAPVIVWDWSNIFDQITVRGDHPWVGITVSYNASTASSLAGKLFGWTSGADALWTSMGAMASLSDDVWRRFQISQDYLGLQFSSDGSAQNGIRNHLLKNEDAGATSSDIYGENGYTGERAFNTSGNYILPALMMRGEQFLPCSVGFADDRMGARQPPVVVYQIDTDKWTDVSQICNVSVEDFPLAVRIDDQQYGVANKQAATNFCFAVTIGLRETEPLKCSWCADPLERVNSSPRTKIIELPQCQQWVVLANTITGVDGTSQTLNTVGSTDVVIRDDTVWLQTALALAVPWYTTPAASVSMTARATLDIDSDTRSGTLLVNLVRGDGKNVINGIIRRSWFITRTMENGRQNAYYNTKYSTQRIPPDVGTIIGVHLG